MACREDRDITFEEVLRLNDRFEVRVEVQTQDTFDLVVFRIWAWRGADIWVPTSNAIRLKAKDLADFVRLGLHAHQSIQSRKATWSGREPELRS